MTAQVFIDIQNNDYNKFNDVLLKLNLDNIFIVCNKSILNLYSFSQLVKFCELNNISAHLFYDFVSNPDIQSVINGLKEFRISGSNAIIAFGGGSAIDIAKCIKYFYRYENDIFNIDDLLNYKYINNDINLIAIPTTAGSGSESTHFAVVYYNNIKYSIEDKELLPNFVILDSSNLDTLPVYQKKSTLLDAFSHAFESFWSINSTEYSKKLSEEALKIIYNNYNEYLNKYNNSFLILNASNISGQAINITKTTAAHAMSYSLTKIANISHGHSVSLCLKSLITYVFNNYNEINCNDSRGIEYLKSVFNNLVSIFNCIDTNDLINKLNIFFNNFDLQVPVININDLEYLVGSVNIDRLNNNPIKLNRDDIKQIYLNSIIVK